MMTPEQKEELKRILTSIQHFKCGDMSCDECPFKRKEELCLSNEAQFILKSLEETK